MPTSIHNKTPAQKRREAARKKRGSARRRSVLIGLAAGGAVAAVLALVLVGELTRGGPAAAPMRAHHGADRTLGSPSAPVVLEVWEDFQCPFCRQANDGPLARVITEYVETQKVQVVFHHYAFLGRESLRAAEAAECAGEQQQFWQYHDILFANQGRENSGAFSDSRLRRYAGEIGLDETSFGACLDSGRHLAGIEQERRDGQAKGVDSTPVFFVNGRKIVGAQPYSVFRDAIESALAAQ